MSMCKTSISLGMLRDLREMEGLGQRSTVGNGYLMHLMLVNEQIRGNIHNASYSKRLQNRHGATVATVPKIQTLRSSRYRNWFQK
jgi:hypothetical protein